MREIPRRFYNTQKVISGMLEEEHQIRIKAAENARARGETLEEIRDYEQDIAVWQALITQWEQMTKIVDSALVAHLSNGQRRFMDA